MSNPSLTTDATLTLAFSRDTMGEGTEAERAAFANYCAQVAREVAREAGWSAIVTTRPTRLDDENSRTATNAIFDACCAYSEDEAAAMSVALRTLGYAAD